MRLCYVYLALHLRSFHFINKELSFQSLLISFPSVYLKIFKDISIMAMVFLAWELMVLQEHVHHQERRLERIVLRDLLNPFNLPYNEFLKCFRISPGLAMDLINLLRPHLQQQRLTAISPEIKVIMPFE